MASQILKFLTLDCSKTTTTSHCKHCNSFKHKISTSFNLQLKPNILSAFTHINSNKKMASSCNLSVNFRGRVKKPTKVTYYLEYYNCGVQACAMVSTALESPNKIFWICRLKKYNFWQCATK